MTANDIKEGLRRCSLDITRIEYCDSCPCRIELTGEECGTYLPKMALAYILELEAGAKREEE